MKKLLLFISLLASSSFANASVSYTYVGSWYVDSGPQWNAKDSADKYTTPVFSGVEAAAYLFGGSVSDYAISTVSNKSADINFKAWVDTLVEVFTPTNPIFKVAQDYKYDSNNDGLYAVPGDKDTATSAYVFDHRVHQLNYAFRISNPLPTPVPVPTTVLLLASGLMGLFKFRAKQA